MKKILLGIVAVVVVAGGVWYLTNDSEEAQPTQQPSLSATPSPTPPFPVTPTPTPDPRCIVTIDGQKYDVTDFRNVHPGGNIFTCGSDMSSKFHDQHGDGMEQLQQIQNLKVN